MFNYTIKIITNKIFGNKFPIDENMQFIVLNLRMPRIILAILVGSSLALTGCGLQSLFKNPMADPYITGTSSGALFGASLALVLFKDNNLSLAIASFIGSLLSTFVIYNFANKKGKQKRRRDCLLTISSSFGSPSRARTYDPAVNSRMLYQLSY